MKNKLLAIFITSIFIIIFIFFYKGLENSNIYSPAKKINNEIPLFKGSLFYSSETINSSNLFKPDKFYLLNIWSSWCIPCRKEHPLLINLKQSDNLELIGINYKDTKNNAKNFLDELGNPYKKIIVDKNGTNSIEWGAFGVPETFIIYNNKIIKKYIGPLNHELLIEIQKIIK